MLHILKEKLYSKYRGAHRLGLGLCVILTYFIFAQARPDLKYGLKILLKPTCLQKTNPSLF